ncbi:hypothetical protein Rhe02_19230 [Rhizocola hellebori]|uniref:Tetratricopeptide repeat protein n=1 Tax=Rhizocola hellebori TaxID=1392758 RepID=A0A8J3Q521_9ACTN|nr:tetratricopeptide repeat protein [Rhizocola hellebori]GIH03856.1 hypothetical protein Rhe02_19230 [Rhizocola hellebori]
MSLSPNPANPPAEAFTAPPDPGQAATLDDLVVQLRLLKVWAGNPSYERITDRINTTWRASGRPASELARKNTVADCFKTGRRRIDSDLLIAVVQTLHSDLGYATQWRQALRVISGQTQAAAQIRVQDALPQDLATFIGRTGELDQLRLALHDAHRDGVAVVISTIEGMAGVGKTQLAVHAGHVMAGEKPFDRVLFVDLRGFHPDPAQPPADPAAVLDGFLRLLGVPGQQIPHDLASRAGVYRRCLAGARALVVLDNAADTEQVRPLVAGAGSLTLVTSRRHLDDLQPAIRLTVEVFTAEEAIDFLSRAVPEVAVGGDPHATARIAARCGYLPLALGLVAGHIRNRPGWTLTDHADRLDERHHHRQLDGGVQLALDLSYQHLPADRQRLLRLVALHPGQDFDVYAAAAMAHTDLPTTRAELRHLCGDNLLQQATPGRYSIHDLVRVYATDRAIDQDRPQHRHSTLSRLFDFYLATAATAMEVAYPHEQQHRRPDLPAGVTPDLSDRDRAEQWLDTELTNLLATAQHAAIHGWHEHTWQLSTVLDRHLRAVSRFQDAQTLHQHALHLARHLGNSPAEMNALNGLGHIHRMWGRHEQAGDHFGRALQIALALGERAGELNALNGLGQVHWTLGRHEQSGDHYGRALQVALVIGDRAGERYALSGLGFVHLSLGRREQSGDYFRRALQVARAIGDRVGELNALNSLGHIDRLLGRYQQAEDNNGQALQIAQAIGNRAGELIALSGRGFAHLLLGRHEQAGDCYGRALQIAQAIGDRVGELYALNGLGHVRLGQGRHSDAGSFYQQVLELAQEFGHRNWQFEALQGLGRLHHACGQAGLALIDHQRALEHATSLAQPTDQARAHDGLAHAHRTLNQHDLARWHWQRALDILTSLGTDHTDEPEANALTIRGHLNSLAA